MRHSTRFCPACSERVEGSFAPGPGRRENASCPRCHSLERHRFLALLLDVVRPSLGEIETLLDIAPVPIMTEVFKSLGAQRIVRLDIGFDNRLVDVCASLTALPLPDESIDLLICYHVLEHIPDDRTAMAELARVLRPEGLAILQVPHLPDRPTDEDPQADDETRIRRFGQRDHVRMYGADFVERLAQAGLATEVVTPLDLVGPAGVEVLGLVPHESVWIARRSDDPQATRLRTGSALPRLLDALLSDQAGLDG